MKIQKIIKLIQKKWSSREFGRVENSNSCFEVANDVWTVIVIIMENSDQSQFLKDSRTETETDIGFEARERFKSFF